MATTYLTFTVYLKDEAEVKRMQGLYPGGWPHGPQPAATEYGIPLLNKTDPFVAPCVRTPWYENSGKFLYDRTVFHVNKGGFFGFFGATDRFVWLGKFEYVPTTPTEGSTDADAGPVETAPLTTRKWILGFEIKNGESDAGDLGNGGGNASRDASRTVDGLGRAARQGSSAFSADADELGVAFTSDSWERIYLRPRRFSTGSDVTFLWVKQTSGNNGLKLKLTSGGQIAMYSTDGTTDTLSAVTPVLTLGTWAKLDLTYEFYVTADSGGTNRSMIAAKLFVNGTLAITGGGQISTGSTLYQHGFTQIVSDDPNSAEYDLDDWTCCALPDRFKRTTVAWSSATNYSTGAYCTNVHNGKTKVYRATANSGPGNGGAVTPPNASKWIQSIGPVDFFSGTHIRAARPQAFGASHNATGWAGLTIQALSRVVDVQSTSGSVSSTSTPSVVASVTTDAKNAGQGVAAITYAVYAGKGGAGTAGTVSADVAGVAMAPVLATDEVSGGTWVPVLTQPPSGALRNVEPLTINYIKAADAAIHTLAGMAASLEHIGVFDACDVVEDPTVTPAPAKPTTPRLIAGHHNAPYPRSPWVVAELPPLGGVFVRAGTYVGNSTAQDLTFPVPPHFLWIRSTSANNGGNRWWSSMFQGGHVGLERSAATQTGGVQVVELDPTYTSPGGSTDSEVRYRVRINGNDAGSNQAVTYQYVMVSDPAARFLLNGALYHGNHASLDDGAIDALADTTFQAAFGLFQLEDIVVPRSSTANLYGKGPGHAADEGSLLNAAATASLVNIATAGQLKTFTALNGVAEHIAYALMRTAEVTPSSTQYVFATRAYVGNGAAGTRDIVLSPASGSKRPLWALVIPDNGAAYFRDPSFSGGNSQTVAGGTPVTTAITGGGVDFITVGTTLNANAVDYSVLVLYGGATAGNDGWSANGDFWLAPPDTPTGTQYTPPTLTEGDVDVLENPPAAAPASIPGNPDLDQATTLGSAGQNVGGLDGGHACEYYTRLIVNRALRYIGVSQKIANLATDNTEAAILARDCINDDVNQVLRDYAWPFATGYASLAVVGGTTTVPVNPDWQYSYRGPNGMMAARRIVGQDGQKRAYDPNPITFKLGGDATGPLVFSDSVASTATPLYLEYTQRNVCPAFYGDALFREALAWKVAASLAPALSKDVKKQDYCLVKYQQALPQAKTPAAREQEQGDHNETDADWIAGR